MNNNLLLRYNLQYFAEGSGGEKTEKPSSRKREKAREEGQVVKSIEMNTAILLIAMFVTIKWIIPNLTTNFIKLFRDIYGRFEIVSGEFTIKLASEIINDIIIIILKLLLPIFSVAVLIGLVINFLQVGFKITLKSLQPKFNKLNPIQGFKRIISMQSIFELIKALIKISLVFVIAYSTIKGKEKTLLVLYDMSLNQIIQWIGSFTIEIGIKIGEFFIIIAVIDYIYQFLKHEKDLKMTKQEVKEEYKMSEGNPEIKSKIRQKMREVSMRRMMQDLPKADVIITNPTHFAVAICYDSKIAPAPIVIAKGVDHLAFRIKEKAIEYNIEIIENKPLARNLYYNVDVGEEIPAELYQAVAEVLAIVYNLKNRNYVEG